MPRSKKKEGTVAPFYKIHIKNSEDVRRLLSSTINELRQGKIDPGRAGKIIYAANVLIGVLEQCSLEERLARIEEAVSRGEI
jgi:hypothetical protein